MSRLAYVAHPTAAALALVFFLTFKIDRLF